MPKQKTIADGIHYFGATDCPVTVRRVQTGAAPSHEHDLTEVEHSHDFCELVIVTHGNAMHWLEGKAFPVTAGDVLLLQGRQRHYFFNRDDLDLLNVMYDPRRLPLPETELRKMPGYSALFVLEPTYRKQHNFSSRLQLGPVALARAETLAEAIESEAGADEPGRGAALLAHLLELIVYLSRQYGQTKTREGKALLRTGEIISAIESDPARDWTVEEMAKKAHMSRSTLFRIFRKATGFTPLDYLLRARIHEAMRLLRESDASVTEIAFACGFSDSNYFSRQFRKYTGQPPTAYRTGSRFLSEN